MKRTRLPTIVLFSTAIAAAACVPDPLDGFDDMGTANNNPNAMPGDMTTTPDMGGGGNFNPEFLAVTAILRPNCLIGGCHGSPAAVNDPFVVINGTLATDAELQTILSSTIPTVSGLRLVTPSNATMSEMFIRVSKPAGDLKLMGAGQYGAAATPLTPAQVTAIQTWIANGATYTQ